MLNWSWDTRYNSRIDMGGGDTAHKNRFGHCTKFRIRGWGDTAQENMFRYLYWGGDTAHNTTYYSESGGDTAQ